MKQIRLLLGLQRKILLNYLKHQFAGKTLLEIAFGLFLLLASAVRFHNDIGFLWIHAQPAKLIPIFQNALFAVFFLFVFAFQLPAQKALRIPSDNVLLSLPFNENELFFFRFNALLVRLSGWLFLLLLFYLLAVFRFPARSPAEPLGQWAALSLGFLVTAEWIWAAVQIFGLLFLRVQTWLRLIGVFLGEGLLFFGLAVLREPLLPFFHPNRNFGAPFYAGGLFLFLALVEVNRRLFGLSLKKELHLERKSQSKALSLLGKLAERPLFFFPVQARGILNLELQTQLRTNTALKPVVLIFILILLTGKLVSTSATDFVQNSLFGVLVLWIFLSAFFFGSEEVARKSLTFYKNKPLDFSMIWLGRVAALWCLFSVLNLFYFGVMFLFYPGQPIPLWSVILLFVFSFSMGILQTNFHLTLLQNVRTGEYIYLIFWVINWVFWFVFPFLPLVLLLGGMFAVRPARTRFREMEETWSI